MKCENCEIKIDSTFSHAISSNVCPACGEQIMKAEKLAAYVSLQKLLEKADPELDSEAIANIIVANFEIKQLFKEDNFKNKPKKKKSKASAKVVEKEDSDAEEEVEEEDYDDEYRAQQMEEAKKIIRKQEYENALREQYGLVDVSYDDLSENNIEFDVAEENPIIKRDMMEKLEKQRESYNKMISGAGGFKRV